MKEKLQNWRRRKSVTGGATENQAQSQLMVKRPRRESCPVSHTAPKPKVKGQWRRQSCPAEPITVKPYSQVSDIQCLTLHNS